jgi:hypothetical protein
MLIFQKLRPFSKYVCTQATKMDPDRENKCHICLNIEGLFQTSKPFKPNPPSIFGKQISPQATLALANEDKILYLKVANEDL